MKNNNDEKGVQSRDTDGMIKNDLQSTVLYLYDNHSSKQQLAFPGTDCTISTGDT